MKSLALLVLSVFIPVTASGHHSRAEFSDETVEIEGILTNVVWANPHVALTIEVRTETGSIEEWHVEGWTNPAGLERAGVARDRFVVGQSVTVAGRLSRFRRTVLGTNVLLASGTEALLSPDTAPRWSETTIGGSEPERAPLADAATENLGIFRAWYPVRSPMMMLRRFPYTEEALAARERWNPVDNPLVRCEEPGMPMPLFHPRPFLFTDRGDEIGLHLSYFDIERTIHMDEDLVAADQPATHLGFSRGHWEGESTLLIETTRVDYPTIDLDGTAQSDQIRIVERYSVSEDQTQLDLALTIEDPVALSETVNVRWQFLALDEPFEVYECNVY